MVVPAGFLNDGDKVAVSGGPSKPLMHAGGQCKKNTSLVRLTQCGIWLTHLAHSSICTRRIDERPPGQTSRWMANCKTISMSWSQPC